MADGNVPAKPRRYATGPAWSDAELAALFDLYPKAKRAVVEAAIPARAWGNIIAQANVRGVRRDVHFWSAAQEERLREMWPDCGRRSITRAVGHGWGGVLQCARRLGLRGRTVRAQPQTNTSGAVEVGGAEVVAGGHRVTLRFGPCIATMSSHHCGGRRARFGRRSPVRPMT